MSQFYHKARKILWAIKFCGFCGACLSINATINAICFKYTIFLSKTYKSMKFQGNHKICDQIWENKPSSCNFHFEKLLFERLDAPCFSCCVNTVTPDIIA